MTMAQPKSPRVSIRAPAWGANNTLSLHSPSTVFAFSTRKSMKLRIFALR